MSILPIYFPINTKIKVSIELSLENQLNKLMFFSNKVNDILIKERSTYYIPEKDFRYYLETLINNFSTLIEYFNSYLFYSIMGTVKTDPVKLIYKYIDLNNIESNEKNMEKIFKKLSIGVINGKENQELILQCQNSYFKNSKILFSKKYHELYVLNNFIKHNSMLLDYAPRIKFNNEFISFSYIRIENENNYLLQDSVLLLLSNFPYNEVLDEKKISPKKPISNNIFYSFFSLGSIKLINKNGIDYNKATGSIGITVESILDVTYSLCLDILKAIKENQHHDITLNTRLSTLESEIKNKRKLFVHRNIINTI